MIRRDGTVIWYGDTLLAACPTPAVARTVERLLRRLGTLERISTDLHLWLATLTKTDLPDDARRIVESALGRLRAAEVKRPARPVPK